LVNLIQGIARGLVGRLAARLLRAETGDQPPFAQLMAASMSASDAQVVDGIARRLADLPITSDEARRIASRLVRLVNDLKTRGVADAQGRIAEFVSQVSRELVLSQNDAATLKRVTEDYAQRELLIGLPV
jgi:hypothetical protein